MCAPGRNPRTTCLSLSSFRSNGRDFKRESRLLPGSTLEHVLSERDGTAAVGLVGKREGLFLHAADPGLIGRRSVLERCRHHGKAADDLAALEQQVAQGRLCAGMAFLGGEL